MINKSKNTRLSITLPTELLNILEGISKATKTSKSSLLQLMLISFINDGIDSAASTEESAVDKNEVKA
jgi:metal-responsive CopG/Arc/MetJ family transcriptional regulator